MGRGGISKVSRETGLNRETIRAGCSELANPIAAPQSKIRKLGAGRKKTVDKDPTLKADLERMIDPITRGDPESPLRWTCKSTRQLADALNNMGHLTSHRMVGKLLKTMGYSLQSNRKTSEGGLHPDRDAQFEHIHDMVKEFQSQTQPVISVDTKKKACLSGCLPSCAARLTNWTKSRPRAVILASDLPTEGLPAPFPGQKCHGVDSLGGNRIGIEKRTGGRLQE